jgi:hypothetical protein
MKPTPRGTPVALSIAACFVSLTAAAQARVPSPPWPAGGKGAPPVEGALYYGGYTQKDVKPTADSLLLKLGMEKMPPIVTTAVLLDAKKHVGGGHPMKAGEVVYVHTGWGDHRRDPDTEKRYYSMAPGK